MLNVLAFILKPLTLIYAYYEAHFSQISTPSSLPLLENWDKYT
jgi:hypothetical protein